MKFDEDIYIELKPILSKVSLISSPPSNIYINKKDSIAISLGAILAIIYALDFFQIFSFNPIDIFSLIPALSLEPGHFHRLVTAGWIHADWIHVLGNILVIALVGVPLEQRLGAKRWMIIYVLGLLGGNLAWWGTHMDSLTPALGASGACFGLLGAYLACWPNDKIIFPLIFLIDLLLA